MSMTTRIKLAAVAMLVGAAVIGRPGGSASPAVWVMAGFLVFGMFNVFVAVPGTLGVRAIAVAGSAGALIWADARTVIGVLAWLAWPPAVAVAWALERESRLPPAEADVPIDRSAQPARIAVAAIIGAAAIASIAYRIIHAQGLQQTAALFVGLPALTAIIVVFAVSPRSAPGVACKAVTVALLASAVLLQEGILCLFMAAPLFYLVAIVIAGMMEAARGRDHATMYSALVLLAVAPLSLEGVTEFTTFNRDESVSVTATVPASALDVERALFRAPRFERALPLYLRAGFPRPISTRMERTADGLQWVVRLSGGEMYLNGMEPRAGDLVLALEDARPGQVRWRAVSDSSHMTHFLTWREVVVQWQPSSANTTAVTWTVQYRRGLDPSWYFGPWERYAVRLAARYLIDTVATP